MLILAEKDDIEERLRNDPPALPPFLEGKREPRREYVIMPDIRNVEIQSKTQHENCWTIHYVWMMRMYGAFERIEVAHVNSRRYRQWLETYPMPDGIPPHIAFGGAIVPGEGDPEFYNKWKEYARRTFC